MSEVEPMGEAAKKQPPRWISLTMAAVALAFCLGMSIWLVVGGLQGRVQSRPVPGGVVTTGAVVKVLSQTDRSTTYRAVIRFADRDGRQHTFTGQSGDERPVVGQPAQVSYDPADPGQAHDLTFNHTSWKWPFWTGILIGTFTLAMVSFVGVAEILRRRRRADGHEPVLDRSTTAEPHTQGAGDISLTRVEKGRVIGLWVAVPVFWIARIWVDFSVSVPIATTVVASLGTLAILTRAVRARSAT